MKEISELEEKLFKVVFDYLSRSLLEEGVGGGGRSNLRVMN
jgi:hypothetical protein